MARKGKGIVYSIRNTTTGRCYIGSTCYKTDRWSKHRNDLRKGVHKNSHLQASWSKHGEEAFEFLILETVETDVELVVREQFWMDSAELKFNIRKIAENNRGTTRSEEQKQAMRDRRHSPETVEKCRQIWLGKELSEEHRQRISASNQGKVMSVEARERMSAASRHTTIMTAEQRARAANTRAKEYIVTTPEGEEIRIRNMRKFCRENNLQQGLMTAVLRGRQSHHRGYRARPAA